MDKKRKKVDRKFRMTPKMIVKVTPKMTPKRQRMILKAKEMTLKKQRMTPRMVNMTPKMTPRTELLYIDDLQEVNNDAMYIHDTKMTPKNDTKK